MPIRLRTNTRALWTPPGAKCRKTSVMQGARRFMAAITLTMVASLGFAVWGATHVRARTAASQQANR